MMLAAIKKHKWWVIAAVIILGTLFILLPTLIINMSTKSRRFNAADLSHVPESDVTIVFGAGVQSNGEPTPYLRRRLETAADLYKAGRTHTLLLSGDNGVKHYNEPQAMKRYAEGLGVKTDDIVLDYAGFNTYDSCYRAGAIFGLRKATIVSQGYHLPRAITTCRGLGVDVVGVAAKSSGRDNTATYIMREYVSTDKALLQIIFKPHPRLLGEPIKIE
ncbi:MAG TPA: ElyC/SanA/YdcF family protein [Candidatus Saccharimonadales bacterium]|nr:ElyC/SanA/YdcF family protein [Candidatus Saccharimonadales bacterium]